MLVFQVVMTISKEVCTKRGILETAILAVLEVHADGVVLVVVVAGFRIGLSTAVAVIGILNNTATSKSESTGANECEKDRNCLANYHSEPGGFKFSVPGGSTAEHFTFSNDGDVEMVRKLIRIFSAAAAHQNQTHVGTL